MCVCSDLVGHGVGVVGFLAQGAVLDEALVLVLFRAFVIVV